MCLNVSGVFRLLHNDRRPAAPSTELLGTYESGKLAQQNIVERLATPESTFGRSDGMLTEVLGTSLRGSE